MALEKFYNAIERFRLSEERRETDVPAAPRTEIVVRKTIFVQPISKKNLRNSRK